MIFFSIPSYGIQFKCLVDGDVIDLEFGALFTLLRFVRTSLAKENIKSLKVHSSNAQLVFALINKSHLIEGNPQRKKMLDEYLDRFNVTLVYVPPTRNKSLIPPVDHPCIPKHKAPAIKPDSDLSNKARIRPIQKGIDL